MSGSHTTPRLSGARFEPARVQPTRVRSIAAVEWLDEASLYVASLLAGIMAGVLVGLS